MSLVSNTSADSQLHTNQDDHSDSNVRREIPVEIIASIFETLKLAHDEDARDCQDSSAIPPEVLVSHVNSYFRAVAISTPTLWHQLSINAFSALDQVKTYLSRSSGCLLDIRAQLFADSADEMDRLDALLDLIIPQSHRWRSLAVFQGLESIDRPLLIRLCNAATPNLKHLTLDVENVDSAMEEFAQDDISLPQTFKSASRDFPLEFVRLRGVAMNYFRPPLLRTTTLHLEQLKRVSIQYRTLRTMLTIPANLINLSVSGDIIQTRHWPSLSGSLSLPNLLALRISSVSGETYARLLIAIDAPQLRSLCLMDVQESDLDGLWSNKCPLASTFSSVQKLSFINFDLSPTTFEKLCQIFPNVTTFRTFYSSIETCQFVYLVLERPWERQGNVKVLWPMLQHVTLLEGKEGKADKRIARFIDSRRGDGSPLSSLTFLTDFDDDYDMSAYQSGVKIHSTSTVEPWPDTGSSFLDLDDQWCNRGG